MHSWGSTIPWVRTPLRTQEHSTMFAPCSPSQDRKPRRSPAISAAVARRSRRGLQLTNRTPMFWWRHRGVAALSTVNDLAIVAAGAACPHSRLQSRSSEPRCLGARCGTDLLRSSFGDYRARSAARSADRRSPSFCPIPANQSIGAPPLCRHRSPRGCRNVFHHVRRKL